MIELEPTPFTLLSTGVPGLDLVLGGGLPEYSLNLVMGAPGSGKTTLVHQILFANVSAQRPALYFTIIGEPSLKMLRYQQRMGFFEASKIGGEIRFVDLSEEALTGDLEKVLARIVAEVTATKPAFIAIDSFRSLVQVHRAEASQMKLQSFLQRLALQFASWEITSFLIGEYGADAMMETPILTIADSILLLSQAKELRSTVRKLEVLKLRGMPSVLGVHTFRIGSAGVQVFPRMTMYLEPHERFLSKARSAFGIPPLDEMLGGGLPAGDATIVAGPSGIGKTVLGTHFISEGVIRDEPGVLAVFEERPADYLVRSTEMGFDLPAMVRAGKVEVLQLRPLDLSTEEILHQIQDAVVRIGARRVVIDSLNGLEIALSPGSRDEFLQAFYRMIMGMTGGGISVLMTIEIAEAFNEIRFSPHGISFLAQNILFLRYVEIVGQLRRVLAVVKMRRSAHSQELREFEITSTGFRLRGPLVGYSGLLTGTPVPSPDHGGHAFGLTSAERRILDVLLVIHEASEVALAHETGLALDKIRTALRHLEELDHVTETRTPQGPVFRIVGRVPTR